MSAPTFTLQLPRGQHPRQDMNPRRPIRVRGLQAALDAARQYATAYGFCAVWRGWTLVAHFRAGGAA